MVNWRDLFRWTFLNRTESDKVLTYHELLKLFSEAADTGGLFHFTSPSNDITGIVLANVNHATKCVHVNYCRLVRGGLLSEAFQYFHKTFPGYTLTAVRYGRKVTYFK